MSTIAVDGGYAEHAGYQIETTRTVTVNGRNTVETEFWRETQDGTARTFEGRVYVPVAVSRRRVSLDAVMRHFHSVD